MKKIDQDWIKKEIKEFPELSENEYTIYTVKVMLRGKFLALPKKIRSHTSNLRTQMKVLEQKEIVIPNKSRWWNNQTMGWNQ